jgi:peptidoglycan hydrolase-like protein with peptidoglycan-binding domain
VSERTLAAPFGALGPFNLNTGISTSTALKAGISLAGLAAAAAGTLGPSSSGLHQQNAKADANISAQHQGPSPASAAPVMGIPTAAPPAPPADPNLLQLGSNGPEVTKVQRAVGATQDGNFGPETRADVVTFQGSHGLAADGVVGPQTQKALLSGGGSSSKSSSSSNASSSSSYHASDSSASSSSGYSLPSYIVQCESQGNYHAVNSSTGAGGAYQIMPSTWRAYGGSGSPQSAPKAEQDRIASKIYQSQGSSPWSCAK